jgi:hypothetical protein
LYVTLQPRSTFVDTQACIYNQLLNDRLANKKIQLRNNKMIHLKHVVINIIFDHHLNIVGGSKEELVVAVFHTGGRRFFLEHSTT